jgi:hypothetical protein
MGYEPCTNIYQRGSIASLIRLKYIPRLTKTSINFYSDSIDLAVWSGIELTLGICAGSLATLRPLLRKLVREARTLGTRNSSSHPTTMERTKERSVSRTPLTGQSTRLQPTLASQRSVEKSDHDEEACYSIETGGNKTEESSRQSVELTALSRIPITESSSRRKGSIVSQLQPLSVPAVSLMRRGSKDFDEIGRHGIN